jgi:hypothetical protein
MYGALVHSCERIGAGLPPQRPAPQTYMWESCGAAMEYLIIPNWENHQHYKDRSPPWIKLSTSTFQDYEFARLQDASKLLAVCIWTLASRYSTSTEGRIPCDFEFIKRQCNLSDFVTIDNLQELINKGFLISDSVMLAECKQGVRPETYSKEAYSKETETEKKPPTPLQGGDDFILPYWISTQVWNEFVEMRKRQKKNPTTKAKNLVVRELEKLQSQGHDPTEVLEQSIRNGWIDVYPIKEKNNGNPEGFRTRQRKAAFAASGLAEGKREPTAYEIITSQAGGNSQPISEAIPALLIGKREPN